MPARRLRTPEQVHQIRAQRLEQRIVAGLARDEDVAALRAQLRSLDDKTASTV